MRQVESLLPIGSVVLLREAEKKLMIYGVLQTDETHGVDYDYIGVVYPEGSMGEGTSFLFNHDDIEDVYFKGYEDPERETFLQRLEEYYAAQDNAAGLQ